MPKRCSDTHFYVSGHKTRSGQAVYTAPDGTELAVVCGRNRPGPGQIHLRDVPDGVTLSVTGHGGSVDLVLYQGATRGLRGRRIPPWRLPPEAQSQIVWNNLVELPAHHADYRWASGYVRFWLDHALTAERPNPQWFADAPASIVPPQYGSVLDALRGTNAHRYVDRESWSRLSRDVDGYGLVRAHATRLCGRVCGMDRAADPGAFDSTLRELIECTRAIEGDIPPQYYDRLIAVLVAEAPHLGLKTLEKFTMDVSTAVAFDLASRMVAAHDAPNAATTRALGHQMLLDLLRDKPMSVIEKPWVTLGLLANENFAELHEVVVASSNALPDSLVPAAHRLACPSAAKLLEQIRPDALTPIDPQDAEFRADRLAISRSESARPTACPVPFGLRSVVERPDGFAPAPVPTADRVTMAASVAFEQRLTLQAWDGSLHADRPSAKTIPGPDGIQLYIDSGITSFNTISRLARNGITPWESGLLDEAGVRTTAQKVACGIRDVRAADLAALRDRTVTDVPEALRLARHRLTAEWMLGYETLDIHDRAVMTRLGDLDVSPAGLAAFRAAGRTLDEVFAQAARGVSGTNCLSFAAAGIDDPDVQARLCRAANSYSGQEFRTGQAYVERMSECGLVGNDLVTAIDRRLNWATVHNALVNDLPFAELLKGLDAGVPEKAIDDYSNSRIYDHRDWVTLSRAGVPAFKAAMLRAAGVETAEEMVPYADAPINNPQDAINCVAARTRSRATVTGTAEALI